MVLVVIAYAIILYIVLLKFNNRDDKEAVMLLIFKLIAYPIIFWFCYIFAIINRFHDVVSADEVSYMIIY
jgi:hypothetical protein